MANKLGGAHYDPSRKGKKGPDLAYMKLDRITTGPHIVMLNKDSVYLELLATGQALALADDIVALRRRIEETNPH